MYLNQILERSDVSLLFTLLTLAAFFLALYVMQLTSSQHEDSADSLLIQWLRRASLAGVALSMLWSLGYSVTKQWQPWPPTIGLLIAVVLMLIVRVAAIHARMHRDRARRQTTFIHQHRNEITRQRAAARN